MKKIDSKLNLLNQIINKKITNISGLPIKKFPYLVLFYDIQTKLPAHVKDYKELSIFQQGRR